jgi:multidrug efflux system membrane fusion protein
MKRIVLMAGAMAILVAPAQAAGFDATVQWARRVELGTPVSGVVKTVLAEVGERVAKDQVLARLDEVPFQAAVAEAEATVARRKRERLESLKALNRAKELYAREVLSTVERDRARLEFRRADTALKEAEARLAIAKYRLAQSSVRAPFDAVVIRRHAEPGQGVAAELQPAVLFVVVAADRYRARALLSADDVARLRRGAPATVEVDGREYPGTVAVVGLEPAGRPGEAPRYPVDVEFGAEGVVLRAGSPAEVSLR